MTGNDYVGGLLGWHTNNPLTNSYSTGNVTGDESVGGLIGLAWGITEKSFSSGHVNGNSYIGGLIGNLPGYVRNVYASGSVTGGSTVGGLVGFYSGGGEPAEITNAYAYGQVSGSSYTGGLVGSIWESSPSAPVTSSYWDTETTGRANSVGGTGYVTSAMIKETNSVSIYIDWDFDTIWKIEEGSSYPYLQWQGSENIPYPPSPFAGGLGTESDPYQVATAEQLNEVRNYLDKHFIQTADLDLADSVTSGGIYYNEGEGWEPIGSDFSNTFNGTFNGNSFKINNILINRPSEKYIGLFGINKGTLKNISLENINITGDQYVGGLVGSMGSDAISLYGSVVNSYTSGNVSGNQYVGGLAGASPGNYLQISKSYSSSSVHGNWGVGGLVGMMYGSISDCYAAGNVTGNSESKRIGGLVGEPYGSITNSYSYGFVSGTNDVGGLLGYDGNATSSYYNSETSGQSDNTGKGIPKTTVEMQNQATYVGWSFDTIWSIDEGSYPYLRDNEQVPHPRHYDFIVYNNELYDDTIAKEGDYIYNLNSNPSLGTLTLNSNGSFSYISSQNDSALIDTDFFTYTVNGSDPIYVNIKILPSR